MKEPYVQLQWLFRRVLEDLLRDGFRQLSRPGFLVFQLPERLFPPGTFDYIGSSHNLMHVLVLVTFCELHSGIRELLAAQQD